MVFANLGNHEKEAFFNLLDEYFSSRPEIVARLGGDDAGGGGGGAAAASAISRAFNVGSGSGLSSGSSVSGASASAGVGALRAGAGASPPPRPPAPPSRFSSGGTSSWQSASGAVQTGNASDEEGEAPTSVAGRIAAFSARNSTSIAPPSRSGGPPPVAAKPSASGLVTSQKFGSIDTSSKMSMVKSLGPGGKDKQPPHVAPPVPSAFAAKKSEFGPPPTRRADLAPPVRRSQSQVTQQEEEEEEEEAAEEEDVRGEWAEALYDYEAQDAGDLTIKAEQRILVTEKSSKDWWTGEVDGRSGLFPASYAKLL